MINRPSVKGVVVSGFGKHFDGVGSRSAKEEFVCGKRASCAIAYGRWCETGSGLPLVALSLEVCCKVDDVCVMACNGPDLTKECDCVWCEVVCNSYSSKDAVVDRPESCKVEPKGDGKVGCRPSFSETYAPLKSGVAFAVDTD